MEEAPFVAQPLRMCDASHLTDEDIEPSLGDRLHRRLVL